MRYALAVVWVGLMSCAPMQFENAGSPNKFEDDKYDCELALGYRGHAGRTSPTDQLSDYIVRGRDEMQRCLQRKGWRLAQR